MAAQNQAVARGEARGGVPAARPAAATKLRLAMAATRGGEGGQQQCPGNPTAAGREQQ